MSLMSEVGTLYAAQVLAQKSSDDELFRALVIDINDPANTGENELTSTEILERLDAANRTFDDLSKAVALDSERRKLLKAIADAEGVQQQITPLVQQIADENQRFETATSDHESKVRNLQGQVSTLRDKISLAADAKRRLVNVLSPANQTRYREIDEQCDAIGRELGDVTLKTHNANIALQNANRQVDAAQRDSSDNVTDDQVGLSAVVAQAEYDRYNDRREQLERQRTKLKAEQAAMIVADAIMSDGF